MFERGTASADADQHWRRKARGRARLQPCPSNIKLDAGAKPALSERLLKPGGVELKAQLARALVPPSVNRQAFLLFFGQESREKIQCPVEPILWS
jgi:hypothetical protein